jgi:hypothetical protein
MIEPLTCIGCGVKSGEVVERHGYALPILFVRLDDSQHLCLICYQRDCAEQEQSPLYHLVTV